MKMQAERRRKQRFMAEVALVLVLIVFGMIMIARVFTQYGYQFVESQDEQLYQLAKSVDRNIENILNTSETNLEYVISRRGFKEAQNLWIETGNTEELLERMRENLVLQDEMITAILAVEKDTIFLSTNGKLDYSFSEKADRDRLRPCVDEQGRFYLAIVCEAESDIEYAAVMDLECFYKGIVTDEFEEYDWVLLTDLHKEMLLYTQKDELLIEPVDAVSSATCGAEGVHILRKREAQQMMDTDTYKYRDHLTEEEYRARIISIPSGQTENGLFGIGIVTNFEDVMKPLEAAAVRLVGYGGAVAIGVFLLLLRVLRYRSRSERDLKELELLREKNDVMQKVNEQMRDLAHHQRLETIGTLTSGIAHEFNNLLTPIMGYSILALEQLPPEDEELYDNILEIYQASRKAKDITSRLSELARKNTTSEMRPVPVEKLVDRVLHVAVPVQPPGVVIEKQIKCEDACVAGNETQLSQLLLNLILNAFQAMEDRKGIVTVAAYLEENYVILRVSDTGTGISEDIKKQIFEPFFTTKEAGKGTGLGLAIVQQVVEEHKGRIKVYSEAGKGSEFVVKLPVYRDLKE